MVLNSWSNNPYGHVAWVYAVYPDGDDDWVLIIHTNMKVGTPLFTHGGATFKSAWFKYSGGSQVYCWDNDKNYALKAFIKKR